MIRQAAFDATGHWYRGCVHVHSTLSDGRRTPQEVVDFYSQQGYDFLALTDHLIVADPTMLTLPAGFTVLPGVEVHGEDPRWGIYHLVGLGGGLKAGLSLPSSDDLATDLRALQSLDALVHMAHPYWSGQSSQDVVQADGILSVEVYNGTADIGYAKGYSLQTWDELLSAGRRVCGLAVDDAHWLPGRVDYGLGWVMVRSEGSDAPALLSALRAGHYYASTGPRLHDVRVEGDEIVVSCSPAQTIAATGERWCCSIVRAANSRLLTEARLKLWDRQCFVRVTVTDSLGKSAWSNPLFLDPAK